MMSGQLSRQAWANSLYFLISSLIILMKHRVMQVQHPPYLPELVDPWIFFAFLKLKINLSSNIWGYRE